MGGGRLTPSIEEVAAIDYLYNLAEDYRRRHGRAPVELSHWDPSESFAEAFPRKLAVIDLGEPLHYRYSFESDVRTEVTQKLGYTAPSRRILLTENGTNAVLAVANALALMGVRGVALLSPCYFATGYALERFGIEVRRLYWLRVDNRFVAPEIALSDGEALWAESPIFGTGVSADDQLAPAFRDLIAAGRIVIYDRSLDARAGPMALEFEMATNFLSIHAPHKTICVNGLKSGVATFHGDLYDAFDHWADVLAGGLSLSAEAATRHFVSPDFDAYAKAIGRHAAEVDLTLKGLVAESGPAFQTDDATVGYWRTIYAPEVPAALGKDRDWLADLVDSTGAVPIPGVRAGCSEDWGFCFRLNLLRYDAGFRGALRRLLRRLLLDRQTAATR
jgi:aspartate/methionine/tyrosine aminotransferase